MYAKRGAVKAPRRTWFLIVWVPNINKIFPKRDYKSKGGLLIKNKHMSLKNIFGFEAKKLTKTKILFFPNQLPS